MGVQEAEVRIVEGTYEDTTSTVLCGPGVSGESKVNVGLRQESALSPLLFVAGVELISRKFGTKDILRNVMYADDLAVVADGDQLSKNS